MKNSLLKTLLSNQEAFIIDQGTLSQAEVLSPFALTDTLTIFSGIHKQPILHFWQLEQTMILGMKDTRVPYFSDGIASLKADGYKPIIRNSGGLGVIADKGVLNVSLILPQSAEHKLSIDNAYHFFREWIHSAFETSGKTIEAYEISNSYCPGTFDLSIAGKKFAGIAQRRIKEGVAVMAYLSINGNQQSRGEAVRRFYQHGLKEGFGENGFPPVEPAVMENLGNLLKKPLAIDSVKERLLHVFQEENQMLVEEKKINSLMQLSEIQTDYKKQLKKMIQRNQQLEEELHDHFL
ncbi:lipoate--protein ligase family protein [Enterococcus sp. BWB1-3]|uniref:lipoate--protein ligase family protein n=1 Tax=Enterococcus sp. BWB1-3 TaxID=2787713 RepID=UPI00192507CD|nr:lipoate--protein ligase family protein [Enterococcus sp. BWB1-3]MBL1230577.1 lipoate--protein ligase family protein [Enterococcus sp. BWB1-3]